MEMWIDKQPYWFAFDFIKRKEEEYKSQYMGSFCVANRWGGWVDDWPVEVFYQPKPDIEKGHTNYFGLFARDRMLVICNAISAFREQPLIGVLADDGEVIISRYTHDYQSRKGVVIDGGRDYTKTSPGARLVQVYVDGANFRFERPKVIDIAA